MPENKGFITSYAQEALGQTPAKPKSKSKAKEQPGDAFVDHDAAIQIKMLPVSDLAPYAKNPRNNEPAVDAVAASIREFGFKVPIILDRNNEIVAGHTRLKAAKKLGLKEVPCIIADDLTPEQVRAFRLADNKVAELAEWDWDLLKQEIEEIPEDALDFSIFGFDIEEKKDTEEIDTSGFVNESFRLHTEQANLVRWACEQVKNEIKETYGNKNSNGNAIFEVVRQWAEQKKL
jgi:hypothetical protein